MSDGLTSESESDVVQRVRQLLQELVQDPFRLEVGMNLYYELIVDNRLIVRTDVRRPMRGQSAFQTDLCLVECVADDAGNPEALRVPRVVFEFKMGMSTHDVITYSAKARKHKTVYPYLRYGIVVVRETSVPRKFFIHNEALDFCIALGNDLSDDRRIQEVIGSLMASELTASKALEEAAFGKSKANVFQRDIVFKTL